MVMGSQPIDGGHYIFAADEKDDFLAKEPKAAKFMRPYIGAKDFINGGERWILALQDAEPSELGSMPKVMELVGTVREYRSRSKRAGTRKLAKTPTRWMLNVLPPSAFMFIPNVTSERREYVPIGCSEHPAVPSNSNTVLERVDLGIFGILSSKTHMVWLRSVGGKLESRFNYSSGAVYNTFPLPDGGTDSLKKLEPHAQAVLDARAAHGGETVADLYDPDKMPLDLRRAHEKLDRAVDRLYRKEPFKDDHERLKFLLERYGAMVQKNRKILSDKQLKPKPAAKRRSKPKNQKLVPEPEPKPKKNTKTKAKPCKSTKSKC